MPPHIVLSMGANVQVGERAGGAQQNEASCAILGKVFVCVGLIEIAGSGELSSARETTAVMANGGKQNAGDGGSVPNMLTGADDNDVRAVRCLQGYAKNVR